MLDWLWSCSRVREQVRVAVRIRPSCEACTVPKSYGHLVAEMSFWKNDDFDVLADRGQHTFDASS